METYFDRNELEKQQRFLEHLAHQLTTDPHEADDLVQEAWLASMRKPAERANWRAWFRKVTRNLAITRSRSSHHNLERIDEQPPDPRAPTPERILDEKALLAKLQSALRGLGSAQRLVISLRYDQGLSLEEIARHLDIPVATARTRLKRARRQLRARMTGETQAARKRFGLVACLLDIKRRLRRTPWFAGVALPSVILLGVAFLGLSTGAGRGQPATAPLRATSTHHAAGERLLLPVQEATATRSRGMEESAATARLVVRTLAQTDDPPLSGTHVLFEHLDPAGHAISQRIATSDESGRIELRDLPLGKWRLTPHVGRSRCIQLGSQTSLIDLEVGSGLPITGRIAGAVKGAAVWLSFPSRPDIGAFVGRPHADGTFALARADPGSWIGACGAGSTPAKIYSVSESVRTDEPLVLRVATSQLAVRGIVVSPDGRPVAGARVETHLEGLKWPFYSARQGAWVLDAPRRTTVTDAVGAFCLEGLPQQAGFLVALADGFAPTALRVRGSNDSYPAHEIRLELPATLRGSVRAADGTPADGILVDVEPSGPFAPLSARTASDGTFVIGCLPRTSLVVRANRESRPGEADFRWAELALEAGVPAPVPGYASAELEATAPELRWEAVLVAGSEIRGVIRDEDGRAIPSCILELLESSASTDRTYWGTGQAARTTRSNARGEFRFEGCADTAHTVRAYMGESLTAPYAMAEVPEPGGPFVELVVRADTRPSATLRGNVTPAQTGGRLARLEIRGAPLARPLLADADSLGDFEFGPLPPASYTLGLRLDQTSPEVLGEWRLGAHQALDLGQLRSTAGAFSLLCSDPNELPAAIQNATILPFDAAFPQEGDLGRPVARFPSPHAVCGDAVSPGRYAALILPDAPDLAQTRVPFDVAVGTRTERSVTIQRGTRVHLQVDLTAQGDLPERVQMRVLDLDAGELARTAMNVPPGGVVGYGICLVPGRQYRLEIRPGSASFAFTVEDGTHQRFWVE